MAQISLQPTEKSTEQDATGKPSRLFFTDYLRTALIILVVLHHLAIVYGGIPPFYYLDPPVNNPLAGLIALVFLLFNQAWFMGALFLLAGYLTPGSFDRKGSGSFLKDRLIRLGIPLIIFSFVLNPISDIFWYLMPASLTGNTVPLTWQSFWQIYPELLGLGVAWFIALLLIFSFGYAAWRMLTRNRKSSSVSESSAPSYLGIGIFILALALVSYLVRIIIPLGKEVPGFPTLAYLPQYLSFFVVGAIAYRRNWLRILPSSMGVVGFVTALIATVTLFSIGLLSFLKAIENASQQIPPFGYGTWQSAVYALWDTIFAVGMCLAVITFSRRFFSEERRPGTFLSQQGYTVYIIHIPIVVFFAYALRGIELGPFLKFAMTNAYQVKQVLKAIDRLEAQNNA